MDSSESWKGTMIWYQWCGGAFTSILSDTDYSSNSRHRKTLACTRTGTLLRVLLAGQLEINIQTLTSSARSTAIRDQHYNTDFIGKAHWADRMRWCDGIGVTWPSKRNQVNTWRHRGRKFHTPIVPKLVEGGFQYHSGSIFTVAGINYDHHLQRAICTGPNSNEQGQFKLAVNSRYLPHRN